MIFKALFFVLIFGGCTGNNSSRSTQISQVTNISNDTVPTVRKQVSKAPVASYIIPINNPLLHQYFGVKIYETPLTFRYLLKMQYEGMRETDTLRIPNFGFWPIIQVRKGPEKLSCVIGFLDKEKQFKEYKMLVAKDDKLRLIVLKRYTVGIYSTTE